ncbi:MAG: GNAT family N-acetyltransferase [Actinomycetota bacterium]|nr:GNAT family N-acetyltransferase [Actinomycetota bacterium]
MAEVVVRTEAPDREPGATLLADYYAEVARRYPDWSPSKGSTASADEMSPPAGRFLVAYVDGWPVGCGTVRRFDDATAEIKRMYVRPSRRGRGVARRLLAELEAAALEIGYTRLVLDTGERMPEAQALYRSSGYREVDDYNGNPWAAVWFEKRLEPRPAGRPLTRREAGPPRRRVRAPPRRRRHGRS